MKKDSLIHGFIITTFVSLYLIVSVISTIHVIDFFSLSNPKWLAVSLAIAFEIGAAASLASLIVLDKMNRSLVWGLFIVLTAMQMMGNTYYAFKNVEDYQSWVELFGLVDEDPLYQKRILSIISGAILPLVALGFIKSLVDYIRPAIEDDVNIVHEEPLTGVGQVKPITSNQEDTQELDTPETETYKEDVSPETVSSEISKVEPIEDVFEIADVSAMKSEESETKAAEEFAPLMTESDVIEEVHKNEETEKIDNIDTQEKKS